MFNRAIHRILLASYILFFALHNYPIFANPLDSWQDTKAYKPRPVLFLHGLGRGNPDNWNLSKVTLGKYFTKYQLLGPYLETMDFQDPNGSVDTYGLGKLNPQGNSDGWADKIKNKINELLDPAKYGSYANKLNVACHSMGGLAGRWYIVNYSSNYIDKLILMGVPNTGSPLAKEINAISKIPRLGWIMLIPVNSVTSFMRFNLDLWISGYLKIDINGEAVDDLDVSINGSGFLGKLNSYQQPSSIDYFGIVGIKAGLPNWVLFKNWNGGDWVVDKDSQLGSGIVTLKDSAIIQSVHWEEPYIAARESDNKILFFLDYTQPELEIISPSSSSITEIREAFVRLQGRVYKEYLPADTELTINVTRQEDSYSLPARSVLLKPSDLWVPNNPDSPVAEFAENIIFPGNGTYKISCRAKNPAGVLSNIEEVWVKVVGNNERANIIVHAHNQEGKEISSIKGMNPFSVQIYDGDILIGNGAYNAQNHNIPIATVSACTHTIKAVFNGMTKEENITVSPNETKEITFTFERVSHDFKDFWYLFPTGSLSDSGGASGSVGGGVCHLIFKSVLFNPVREASCFACAQSGSSANYDIYGSGSITIDRHSIKVEGVLNGTVEPIGGIGGFDAYVYLCGSTTKYIDIPNPQPQGFTVWYWQATKTTDSGFGYASIANERHSSELWSPSVFIRIGSPVNDVYQPLPDAIFSSVPFDLVGSGI